MTPRTSPWGAILLVVAMLAAGAVGGLIVALVDSDEDPGTGTSPAADATVVARAPEAGRAAERVYESARGSVVFVSAQIARQSTSPFGTEQGQGQSTGTGFVVGRQGTIATNAHVVEGARDVTVRVGDAPARAARIVETDPSTDIALLRIEGGGSARPLPLADSDEVVVGEAAYAIGNPYGLDRTLTSGVVSALQREITAPNGFSITGVIQTDAPINPGNSGGPLLNADVEVIGITSQIISSSSSGEGGNVGIGFAVPSNTVSSVIAQLERDGRAEHAFLGAQTTDAPGGGALIAAVTSGGPAARGGLQAGDVVTGLGGGRIDAAADLTAAVNAHQPGDRVRVALRRDGTRQTVTVTLGTQPSAATGGAVAP